ncbi:response regulator transcription factor [Lactovum odontotermitis]
MPIKIAIIDDHKLVLQGIYKQLSEIKEFEILGTFTEVNQLMLFLRFHKVEVLICDLMLKNAYGFDLVKKIRQEISPTIKVVLVSGFYEEILHKQALELGIEAFLRKEVSSEELIDTIFEVSRGNLVIPASIIDMEKNQLLTETERNVVKLVIEEYTNEEIGQKLFISKRTVESQITSICQKLGVKGRIGIVREGVKLSLN